MEYNTQRDKLVIADYGRNIYKLIEWAKGLEDKNQRNEAAAGIVQVMAKVNPQVMDQEAYERMLWDHLMIMSRWELDVDVPYDIQRGDSVTFHPKQIALKSRPIRYRHYGRLLEDMTQRMNTVEEGREVLASDVARRMKFSYLNWNHNVVEDSVIVSDLEKMTGREEKIESASLELSQELTDAIGTMQNDELSQKKKKKK